MIRITLVEIRLRPCNRSQIDGPFATLARYMTIPAIKIQITYIYA